MKSRLGEQGIINTLLIPLVMAAFFLVCSVGFGVWAYYQRTDYKNNVDQKITAAVEVANQKLSSEKDNEFLEKEKYPLNEYLGPAEFGSIKINYPKTWSAYISNKQTAEYIFNPKIVSADDKSPYALRITVEDVAYDQAIARYDSQVQEGLVKAVVYSLPKVPSIVGVKFDGEVEIGRTESLIVLPLRDKTITIASLAADRFKDFNNIILKDLSLSP